MAQEPGERGNEGDSPRPIRGRIFDIQRFSIHDGPGIRTTVFLKGCPLKCIWCANPESVSPAPTLSFLLERCIGCGACVAVCPENALRMNGDKAALDRSRCTSCDICAATCDTQALEIVGWEATAGEVIEAVLRDRDFYEESGGGLTLSGGEPLQQPDFAEAVLRGAKAQGLHCCMETSGMAPWAVLERLRPLIDLWLFDIKETDPARHAEFTGGPNAGILDNLRRLHAAGARIRLRCPIIPQCNARDDHLEGIAALARELEGLEGVELLPYHELWRGKLQKYGLAGRLPETVKPPEHATVETWIDTLRRRGVRVLNG